MLRRQIKAQDGVQHLGGLGLVGGHAVEEAQIEVVVYVRGIGFDALLVIGGGFVALAVALVDVAQPVQIAGPGQLVGVGRKVADDFFHDGLDPPGAEKPQDGEAPVLGHVAVLVVGQSPQKLDALVVMAVAVKQINVFQKGDVVVLVDGLVDVVSFL